MVITFDLFRQSVIKIGPIFFKIIQNDHSRLQVCPKSPATTGKTGVQNEVTSMEGQCLMRECRIKGLKG